MSSNQPQPLEKLKDYIGKLLKEQLGNRFKPEQVASKLSLNKPLDIKNWLDLGSLLYQNRIRTYAECETLVTNLINTKIKAK